MAFPCARWREVAGPGAKWTLENGRWPGLRRGMGKSGELQLWAPAISRCNNRPLFARAEHEPEILLHSAPRRTARTELQRGGFVARSLLRRPEGSGRERAETEGIALFNPGIIDENRREVAASRRGYTSRILFSADYRCRFCRIRRGIVRVNTRS